MSSRATTYRKDDQPRNSVLDVADPLAQRALSVAERIKGLADMSIHRPSALDASAELTMDLSNARALVDEATRLFNIVRIACGEDSASTSSNPVSLRASPKVLAALQTPIEKAMNPRVRGALGKLDVVVWDSDGPAHFQRGVNTVGELVQLPLTDVRGTPDELGRYQGTAYGIGPVVFRDMNSALGALHSELAMGNAVAPEMLRDAGIPRVTLEPVDAADAFQWSDRPIASLSRRQKQIVELRLDQISFGTKYDNMVPAILSHIPVRAERGQVRRLSTVGELMQLTREEIARSPLSVQARNEIHGPQRYKKPCQAGEELRSRKLPWLRSSWHSMGNLLLSEGLHLGARFTAKAHKDYSIARVSALTKI